MQVSNLDVVLYGCKTRFVTLREEHGLRVFKNRMLRKILGPKRDDIAWDRSKLYNKKLHDLYC